MGSKQSRHQLDGGEPLNQQTVDELCRDTGFTEEELQNWHTHFYRDCPDGKLTLKQFEHQYSKIMGKPTQKTFDYVKHMFNVYDQDKNQFIDFKEFVMALSAASVVNRLRLIETLFSVFDLDNDGKITKDEMAKMLHTLVDVTNSNKKRHHHHHHHHSNGNDSNKQINSQNNIDDAFNELNTNDDDHITKDEFIEWYMRTGLLVDDKVGEINVHDTSRIQQLDKKSRKIKRQLLQRNDNKEANHQQLVRHISHMIEKKPRPTIDDDDDDDDDEEDEKKDGDNDDSTVRAREDSNDTDSHYSKQNERWQHLFNSVLGQIRAQRSEEEEQQLASHDQNQVNHFNSWKKHGAEKIKVEYFKQKSNDGPSSPDVVSIRF